MRPAKPRPRIAGALGVLAYVAVMSAGYYYNLTFVQLGLIDLGERRVGIGSVAVGLVMAAFALTALGTALGAGREVDRRGWGTDLRVRIRLLAAIVTVQTALTAASVWISTPVAYVAWALVVGLVIGSGIPVTFSLMADLVPVAHRGHVAAAAAGLSFAAAAVYPLEWRIESFAPRMVALMLPASVLLAVIASGRLPRVEAVVDVLADQHRLHGAGRFCPGGRPPGRRVVAWLVLAMFAAFFIDSLGFLRIIDTPAYVATSWQSPEVGPRLFLGGVHLVGAAMAGVLYTAFGRRWLIGWIFGLFAFTHLLYTVHLRTAIPGIDPPLALPLFYVLAVSFYTTLNFALWPDLSTSRTIGRTTALGVGVAGWLASFLSTALALASRGAGVSLLQHLTWVNALALLLAAGVPVGWYVRQVRRRAAAHSGRQVAA